MFYTCSHQERGCHPSEGFDNSVFDTCQLRWQQTVNPGINTALTVDIGYKMDKSIALVILTVFLLSFAGISDGQKKKQDVSGILHSLISPYYFVSVSGVRIERTLPTNHGYELQASRDTVKWE